MSQIIHLTFREGEPITLEAIARRRRDLVRNRVRRCSNLGVADYFVMQVHPEHEYPLREMLLCGSPAFLGAYRHYDVPLLPDEIGQILDFRVVASSTARRPTQYGAYAVVQEVSPEGRALALRQLRSRYADELEQATRVSEPIYSHDGVSETVGLKWWCAS